MIERLAPQCDALILNANGDPARFAFTGLPVVPDDVPGFAGPLAGILAALDWAARERPGDRMGRERRRRHALPAARSRRAPARRAQGGRTCRSPAPNPAGRPTPSTPSGRCRLREDLRQALVVEDMRKIDRWTARHGVARAAWPAAPVDPFFNANTPRGPRRGGAASGAARRCLTVERQGVSRQNGGTVRRTTKRETP